MFKITDFRFLFLVIGFILSFKSFSQQRIDSLLPVRGFCVAAPNNAQLERFIKFVDEELSSRKINVLILRIDYNYQYKSHPELADKYGLTNQDVKKLVAVCKKNNIQIIPQINLLGHQSWASNVNNLLRVYPEFDETSHVKMPEKYQWPNKDGLYCKSYCPLHPKVHEVVFALVDEICDAFESQAFHAGMDEVFYIGEDSCKRCAGFDKADLFANEVRLIHNHLALKNRSLWIWGDRLIDGKTTGIGEWEASFNNTYRAIDLIPKDVMICDWHYERADQTPVYFAMKGFKVITCPWRTPKIAIKQVNDMVKFRETSTAAMRDRFQGMLQTVWNDVGEFLDTFYGSPKVKDGNEVENNEAHTFKAWIGEIEKF